MVISGCSHELLELRRSRESSPRNDDSRQSVRVNKYVVAIPGDALDCSPSCGTLPKLAGIRDALRRNGRAMPTEQSPVLSLAHHARDNLAKLAAVRPRK